MSRSKKKEPVTGWCNRSSDKPYKRQEHQRKRVMERGILSSVSLDDPDIGLMPDEKVFGDPCLSAKDGKHYIRDAKLAEKYMRK